MRKREQYRRTEERIRTAFLELLEEHGMRGTTVPMIIARANVNRSAFYLHHTDKYELLESIEREFLEEFLGLAALSPNGSGDAIPPNVLVAGLVYRHRDVISVLNKPDVDPLFLSTLVTRLFDAESYEQLFDEHLGRDLDYTMAGIIGASVGVLSEWVRGGFSESPEEYLTHSMKAFGHTLDVAQILTNGSRDGSPSNPSI